MVRQSDGHDDGVFDDVHPDYRWLNSVDDRWIYDDLIEAKKRIKEEYSSESDEGD